MKRLLAWTRLAKLVWLEDYDSSFHLRIKRKTKFKAQYPGIVGCAKRVGMGIHTVYLSDNGQVFDGPDGKVGYVKHWYDYEWRKHPIDLKRERAERKKNEIIAAQLAASSQNLSSVQAQMSAIQIAAAQAAMNVPSYWGSYYMLTNAGVPLGSDVIKTPKLDTDTRLVHPVSGWRRWSVDCFGMKLKSNNKTVWEPRAKLTAECKRTDEAECEGIHCHCGIYAYKERAASETGENAPSSETHIWGEVWLWGRIVEHEQGFRAQYAYPKAFVRSGIAEQLSEVYGVKLID